MPAIFIARIGVVVVGATWRCGSLGREWPSDAASVELFS
jgi:hypothetical protein